MVTHLQVLLSIYEASFCFIIYLMSLQKGAASCGLPSDGESASIDFYYHYTTLYE